MDQLPNDIINIIENYTIFKPHNKEQLKEVIEIWIFNKEKALKIYGHISTWNTSLITDMSYLFQDTRFNDNINNWDVSNVTNMRGMFYKSKSFNQPLNNWNVSNVNNMQSMFYV